MATRVGRVIGWEVSETATSVVCQVKFSGGRDETDGVSIPHEPVLTPEEFNAKIKEALTVFEPLAEGETFILLGGAVGVGG